MAGFDELDKAYVADYKTGYRSKYLRNDVSQSSVQQYNMLEYNGYVFPPGLSSRITIVPEYDKAQRVVKWLTLAISVEFVLTDPEVNPSEYEHDTVNDRPGLTYNQSLSVLKRLSQPGQPLRFAGQGFGPIEINTGSVTKDLDNGPKPQVTEVQPIAGGIAFKVQWLCVSRISPCVTMYDGKFVSFTYSVEWDFTQAGYTNRSITGDIEFPSYANYNLDKESTKAKHTNIASPMLTGGILQAKAWLLKTFPHDARFIRNWRFKWNEDHKTLNFNVTDREAMTDSYFPPGIANFELKQRLSSNLNPDAFYTWKLAFTGKIEAIHSNYGLSESKNVAWFWLWTILRKKRELFLQFNEDQKRAETSEITNEQQDEKFDRFAEALKDTGFSRPKLDSESSIMMYPISVDFQDDLYGNEITFTVVYAVRATIPFLMLGLKVFRPIKSDYMPGVSRDTWVSYYDQAIPEDFIDALRDTPAASEIIVDICNPLEPEEHNTADSESDSTTRTADVLDMVSPDNGKDWVSYDNSFTYYESYSTITRKVLKDGVAIDDVDRAVQLNGGKWTNTTMAEETEKLQPFSAKRLAEVPNSGVLEAEYSSDKDPVAPSEATRWVCMSGTAMRWSKPINPPVLISVGGARAVYDTTLGLNSVKNESIPVNTQDGSGKTSDLFVCSWKRWYILESKPIGGKLLTTGIPRRFT